MKNKLLKILENIEDLGGEVRNLVFDEPVSENEIKKIEKELKIKIPKDFRDILTNVSSLCDFSWHLPDDYELPEDLSEIYSGYLHWDIDLLIEFNKDKENWIKEVFPNPEDDYDKIWHNKFVFQEVGNGDYISIDLSEENAGKIIYLSHDNGEGHGYVMAENINDLLQNWTAIGCPGAEDWQWLPFVKDKNSGIDPNCENAQIWKEIINL